ncbi:exonuclease domain-containing protein [Pseudoalteromonas shioyasakiensis]|uniref:exonuclease domain-containing protein n=1 Tax=Pseudoalteromonas shioyasakiensis TaxID=1190813 RepID=UPI002119263C|nr:exonuclease domain-containing protein [Pseudoalteromonas shioyasakiensis]MCQ8881935.1 exonuclease domain-containing protein [Pseudoalteromonas shioyasakiensis]
MKTQLPAKYYLSHFFELAEFIRSQCTHLLLAEQMQFLEKLTLLDEQSLCTLLRIYSRKPKIVALSSLNYEEIPNLHGAIFKLKQQGLVSHPSNDELDLLLEYLTKPTLLTLLANDELMTTQPDYKKSASKHSLIQLCKQYIDRNHSDLDALFSQFVVNSRSQYYEYFEFLHSGRLSQGDINHQNRFVMRDLGIAKVRGDVSDSLSRFKTLAEAQSHYQLNQLRMQLKQSQSETQYQTLAQALLAINCEDELAQSIKNKLLIRLYKQLKDHDLGFAFELLEHCEGSSEAQELAIRQRYKLGDKSWVEHKLENIIQNPLDDSILYFAEDFLQRKYNKQQRSRLTQMLIDTEHQIEVDDIYRGDVEQGVCEYYQQLGNTVFFTENNLWLSLFTLTFWQELFIETPYPPCNEFDLYPQVLLADCFYTAQHTQIEQKLANFTSNEALYKYVCKNAGQYYEIANGVFMWHSDILEPLKILIKHSSLDSLKAHLLQMTKTFKQLKDGYPDLMVLKEHKLTFEEVKAPGDKLRRNQLVSIDVLKQHGFEVNIVKVSWFNDPNRIYSVVDIETTGGVQGNNKITEIAVVQLQAGEVIKQWASLINPERSIPAFITKLTGINAAMVRDAPRFEDIADTLRALLKGSVFVAHNVNFDYGFIRKEYAALGQGFKMPKLCTVVESRKTFPKLKSYSLGNLATHFELNLTNHHRALADATATAELLIRIQQAQSNKAS